MALKRILIVCAAVLFAFMFSSCFSETETAEYKGGGVIERISGNYRMRALIEELKVAYLTCDKAYLTCGEQAKWTIVASGGDGVYSYQFRIFHRFGTEGLFSYEGEQTLSSSNVFYHTPAQKTGQYLLEVGVYDSSGAYIRWQSVVYETESGEGSAVLKAREIVSECISEAGAGDYARALWLHDWLVRNADYDYEYEYYYADGVLLYGKGVCQSYAYAYEMMLKMIGIECVYITGTAGGEAHGWNLVKIDGEWYHVDVTWDDPAPGRENRSYFCVTDEIMRKDHVWETGSGIMPECDDETYLYSALGATVMVYSEEDMISALASLTDGGMRYAEMLYRGEDAAFVLHESVSDWLYYNGTSRKVKSYQLSYSGSFVSVMLDYGSGFADLSYAQVIEIEDEVITLSAGGSCALTVYTLPMTASCENILWTTTDAACAYYENGRIYALTPGETVIEARIDGGNTEYVTVRVKADGQVNLPDGIKVIEDEAFMNASSLQTVIVPDSVTEIGDRAFAGCTLLYEIRLPDSVVRISEDAFEGCERLTIYGSEDSYARSYALEHEISFEIITESTLNSD